MTKTTPTPAARFQQYVEDEDVPAPPSDAEGRRNYWIETLFEGVHLLRKRMRSRDSKEAMKALELVMKLEGMMMRHHGSLTGICSNDRFPLDAPLTPMRMVEMPVRQVEEEEDTPSWELMPQDEAPRRVGRTEPETDDGRRILPPDEPHGGPPSGTRPRSEIPPITPRIEPFASRPPDAPRAIVDGPPLEPRMSYEDYHLLQWKREDPEAYRTFMANVGGEPESMRQYSG